MKYKSLALSRLTCQITDISTGILSLIKTREGEPFYKEFVQNFLTYIPIDYKFHDRHRSSAKEIAILVEDSPKKIVIQHLLVMRGDSMIIKHWREDWTYEDQTILAYDQDNAWKKVSLSANDVKGKWTQKVFQVDDSPRYQAIGTWVHVDGRHQWQSNTDSPLPRRESTERKDYNVLKQHLALMENMGFNLLLLKLIFWMEKNSLLSLTRLIPALLIMSTQSPIPIGRI